MKLVAERAKYEKFLAELDKDGASKPANVVARVRADYTSRLEAVAEKLKASHDVLSEHAATLTAQLQKLQDASKRLEDESAELDLRKQVGEIEEEEWETASERVKSDASKINKQQDVMAADIKRIRDVLGSSASKSNAAVPPPAPVGDELAFLKAVVGPTTGATPKATPAPAADKSAARTSAPTPAPRPSVIKPIGPPPRPSTEAPAPRPSVVARERLIEPDPMEVEAAPVEAAAPIKPVKRPTPPKESLIDAPQAEVAINSKGGGVGSPKPLAANVPTGELNLKAMGTPGGATKKAKCPKCSGLNVPSDWYCVHCGAELAI
jgi:hypothetical protein